MSEFVLPPAYQSDIDAAKRRQMMAQALQKQQLNQGQMVGNYYVKASPLAHLAQVLSQAGGLYMQQQGDKDIQGVRERFMKDQADELSKIQQTMAGTPSTPGNLPEGFVGAPGPGETFGQPGQPGNPLRAEQMAQQSQFPAAQALGKTLFEKRLEREKAREGELLKRVSLPDIQANNLERGAPKQTVQSLDGVPVAMPTEYTVGGPQPTRIGPGYTPTTLQGIEGPILAQVNPLTGKVEPIDKTPRVSVTNVAGDKAKERLRESQYEELAKTGRGLAATAASVIPQVRRVTQALEAGTFGGTQADIRASAGQALKLLGFTSEDTDTALRNTGQANQALISMARDKLKAFGANPSNLDLMYSKIASGQISDDPQNLYLTMQALQADLLNATQAHQGRVGAYEADFPEMKGSTRSLGVGQLPTYNVDAEAFELDPATGYYQPKMGYTGNPRIPKQGVTGPEKAPTPAKKIRSPAEIQRELDEVNRQLQQGR